MLKVHWVLKVLVPGVLGVLKVLGVLAVLAALGALGVLLTAAAQAPTNDGVITGRVVDASTGQPVSAAIVSVAPFFSGANPPPSRILTDAQGRFLLTNLSVPGNIDVIVGKSGYADGAYGQNRPNGSRQNVELTAARKTADIVIRLWRYAAITGTVTDEAGEALVRVQVRAVQRRPGMARAFTGATGAAMTDDRGVYRISSLLPGDYIVITSQPGLSAPAGIFADVGRTGRAAGELAALVAGRSMGELAAGLSLQGVRVGDALYSTGRGTITPPPPAGTRMQIYPPTFHPNSTAPAQAAIVTVAAGEERASIDLHLTPVTTLRVSGTLIGPSGPAGMVPLRLLPASVDLVPPEALAAVGVTDASGAFVFPAVVPGNYVLRTEPRESPSQTWLAMPVTVGGDDADGIVATLQAPLRVTARTQFEGTAAPPSLTPPPGRVVTPLFTLEPEDGGSAVPPGVGAMSNADAVTVTGFPPGRYRVRVNNSPAGWMFKAAMLDGVDVSQSAFDVSRDVTDLVLVFTDRWSGIGGVVHGARADRAMVVLFPADSRAWVNAGPSPRRLRSARVDVRGSFGIRSVPAGDYYVVAIPDDQAGDWRDPAVLDALARIATQVTVTEGEHRMIDLVVKEIRP